MIKVVKEFDMSDSHCYLPLITYLHINGAGQRSRPKCVYGSITA